MKKSTMKEKKKSDEGTHEETDIERDKPTTNTTRKQWPTRAIKVLRRRHLKGTG